MPAASRPARGAIPPVAPGSCGLSLCTWHPITLAPFPGLKASHREGLTMGGGVHHGRQAGKAGREVCMPLAPRGEAEREQQPRATGCGSSGKRASGRRGLCPRSAPTRFCGNLSQRTDGHCHPPPTMPVCTWCWSNQREEAWDPCPCTHGGWGIVGEGGGDLPHPWASDGSLSTGVTLSTAPDDGPQSYSCR